MRVIEVVVGFVFSASLTKICCQNCEIINDFVSFKETKTIIMILCVSKESKALIMIL